MNKIIKILLVAILVLNAFSCNETETKESAESLATKDRSDRPVKNNIRQKTKSSNRRIKNSKRSDAEEVSRVPKTILKNRRHRGSDPSTTRKSTLLNFASVPFEIPLTAMVKNEIAKGYNFHEDGMTEINEYAFGEIFIVPPRTELDNSASIDSLYRWVPVKTESGNKVWINSDDLLLREQAFIPVADTIDFYQNVDDAKPSSSKPLNKIARHVLRIVETKIDSNGNVWNKSKNIALAYIWPRTWSSNYWVRNSSIKLWLDEIVERATTSSYASNWKYTPNYDKNWASKNSVNVIILFEKLIKKYKYLLDDPSIAAAHILKYYEWNNELYRLKRKSENYQSSYEFWVSFADDAEKRSADHSGEVKTLWQVAAARARGRAAYLAKNTDHVEDFIAQIREILKQHSDIRKKRYEDLGTFGVSAIHSLYYQGKGAFIPIIEKDNFLKTVPFLTKSSPANSVALLIRGKMAEEKKKYEKADSLYIQNMDKYPEAYAYIIEGKIFWAHTSFRNWVLAPIIREGDYSEARRRLSGSVHKYSEEFTGAAAIISCGLDALEGNTQGSSWEICLQLSNTRRNDLNFNPTAWRAINDRGAGFYAWLRNEFGEGSKRKSKRASLTFKASTLINSDLLSLPYGVPIGRITAGDTATTIIDRTYAIFPDGWTKIRLRNGSEGWVKKSDR